MTTIQKSALVPYTAEEMYALVADVEAYPAFLPWCGGARVLSREADTVVAVIEIAYGSLRQSFTTRNRSVPGEQLEMQLLDGPFRQLQGQWRFHALDPSASKISFHLEFEFSNKLIGFAVGPAFSAIGNTMVDSFRQRAEAVYGRR
jgi:ribosome-associated toxin RatA of RatAB toxin-antitoxin module